MVVYIKIPLNLNSISFSSKIKRRANRYVDVKSFFWENILKTNAL